MKYLFTIIFLILFKIVSCQTIKIDDNFTKITPVSQLFYLADLGDTFDKITIVNQQFKKVEAQNIGIKNGVYWFKLKIKNTIPKSKELIFDIREAIVSQVKIYKLQRDTLNLIYTLDKQSDTVNKYKIFQNVTAHLMLGAKETVQLYLKVTFPKMTYFPLTIRSVKNEIKTVRYRLLRIGLYYGFTLMVFIINFFFFVSLKDSTFLYYIFFLTAITCGFLYYDGFFYEVLQRGRLLYNIESFIHFYIALGGVLFATKFLQLDIHFKTLKKIAISFLIIIVILFVVQIITDNFLFLALADVFGFSLMAIYWISGVLVLKKNDYARFFVLGYSLMLFITPLYMLPLDFGLSGFGIKLEALKLGGMLEMLILTYAITYRTKILQKEYNRVSSELHAFMDKYMALEKTAQSATNQDEDIAIKIKNLKKDYALSDRETEVLLCIAQHKSNKEIADYLYLSVNTIKFHTRNLYEKLDINNRATLRHKLKEVL